MKTERRHELQTNTLADWIGTKVQDLKPYSRAIVGAAIAIVAVIFVAMYRSGETTEQRELGWTEFFALAEAQNIKGLHAVSEKHLDSDIGLWARQTESDIHLQQGISQTYEDRDEAESKLSKAVDGYQLVSERATDEMLKRRAMYGLGQAQEARNQLDKAEAQYQTIISRWPDTMIGKEAQRRLDQLNDPSVKEFYTWFFSQEPGQQNSSPASSTQGNPLGLDTRPIFDLPDDLEIDLGGSSGIGPQPGPSEDDATENPEPDSGDSPAATDDETTDVPAITPPSDSDLDPADSPEPEPTPPSTESSGDESE